LTGSSIGGTSLNNTTNRIQTIAGFVNTVSGGFSLNTARSLTVNGMISSDNIPSSTVNLVSGGSIGLQATIEATGAGSTINLVAAGAITQLLAPGATDQAADVLIATNLTGSSSGGAVFQYNNNISTLGSFANAGGGGFLLKNTSGLTVVGSVDAGSANLSLYPLSGDLTLASVISAGGLVTLVSPGSITQISGSITADTLTGSSGNATLIAQTANRIATLGSFSGSEFSFTDGENVTVSGAIASGGELNLRTVGASMVLTGTLTSPTVVSLVSDQTITQPSGSIIAPELAIISSGNADLTANAGGKANNTINTLAASISGNGTLQIVDTAALTIGSVLNTSYLNTTIQEVLITSVSSVSGDISIGTPAIPIPLINLTKNITTGGGSIEFSGPVTLANDIDIQTNGGNVTFDDTVNSGTTSTLNATQQALPPNSLTTPSALLINAGAGQVTFGGSVGTLEVDNKAYALRWLDVTAGQINIGDPGNTAPIDIRVIGRVSGPKAIAPPVSGAAKTGDIILNAPVTVNTPFFILDAINGDRTSPPGGNINFGTKVDAQNSTLIILIGDGLFSGTNVDIKAIDVFGPGGSGNLTGSINNNNSPQAASPPNADHFNDPATFLAFLSTIDDAYGPLLATLLNAPSQNFRFNGCIIGSTGCLNVVVSLPPFVIPKLDLTVGFLPPAVDTDDSEYSLPIRGNEDLWE
jgi:hypothetical protein